MVGLLVGQLGIQQCFGVVSWINNAKTGLFCEGSFAEQNKPS